MHAVTVCALAAAKHDGRSHIACIRGTAYVPHAKNNFRNPAESYSTPTCLRIIRYCRFYRLIRSRRRACVGVIEFVGKSPPSSIPCIYYTGKSFLLTRVSRPFATCVYTIFSMQIFFWLLTVYCFYFCFLFLLFFSGPERNERDQRRDGKTTRL